jgi:hypothetical protein
MSAPITGDHLKGEALNTPKAFFFKSVSKAEVTATCS